MEGLIVIVFILGGGFGLYFLPTIIAASRKKRNIAAIAVLNIFLGWTLIGWVIALVWSVAYEAPSSTTSSPETSPSTEQPKKRQVTGSWTDAGTTEKIVVAGIALFILIGLIAICGGSTG